MGLGIGDVEILCRGLVDGTALRSIDRMENVHLFLIHSIQIEHNR